MKTSSAKQKGRDLQKHVVKVIVNMFNLGEDDCVSRPMGSSGVDIMMSPLCQVVVPFSIECKNTKKFPSLSALKQSKANKYHGTIPAVVWKPPGKGMNEAIIYFNLEEFLFEYRRITCQNQK